MADNDNHNDQDVEEEEVFHQRQLQLIHQGRREPPPQEEEKYFEVETYKKREKDGSITYDYIAIEFYWNPPHEPSNVDISNTYFLVDELEILGTFLEKIGHYNNNGMIPEVCLFYCEMLEFKTWVNLLNIINKGIPNLEQLEVILNPVVTAAAADSGIDQKLTLLPNDDRFQNLRRLEIHANRWPEPADINPPHFAVQLPRFYQSIRQLQSLEEVDMTMRKQRNGQNDFSKFYLNLESLYILADSIENLPNLEDFSIDQFVIPIDPEIEEVGWEAFFCAVGSHPKIGIHERWSFVGNLLEDRHSMGRQCIGDPTGLPLDQLDLSNYAIPGHSRENYWNTVRNGPTVDQVLTQLKRQRRLPEGFPQNNRFDGNNLEDWVEALIVVKDIQLKGEDRWDVFHFLFSQLVPTMMTYNNMNQEYLDTSDPNVRVPWLDSEGNLKKELLSWPSKYRLDSEDWLYLWTLDNGSIEPEEEEE